MYIDLTTISFAPTGGTSKKEVELVETITDNGEHTYTPESGSVYKSAVITTDIHPEEKLVDTLTENGIYRYAKEYSGVEITVNVGTGISCPYYSFGLDKEGLKQLGYEEDFICMLEGMCATPKTQPDLYVMTEKNKEYGSTLTTNDFWDVLKNDPENIKYPPLMDTSKYCFCTNSAGQDASIFANSKIVTIPKYDFSDARTYTNNYFQNCSYLIALPDISMPNQEDASKFFTDDFNLLYIGTIDMPKLKNAGNWGNGMFRNCKKLKTIRFSTVVHPTSTQCMFFGCSSLTDIENLDTSQSDNTEYMFYDCSSLTDIGQFDFSKSTNATNMFFGCYSLTGDMSIDVSSANSITGIINNTNISSITFVNGLGGLPDNYDNTCSYSFFEDCPNLREIHNFDCSKIVGLRRLVGNCPKLEYIEFTNMDNITTISTNCGGGAMLSNLPNLRTVKGLEKLRVSNYDELFYNSGIQTMPKMDLSKATSVKAMFSYCSKLETVGNNIDLPECQNVSNMFAHCTKLSEVPEINAPKATDLSHMFDWCESLTTAPQMNIPSATNISNMFAVCSSLQRVPVIDTSSVEHMNYLFYGCKNLTTIEGIDFTSCTSTTQIWGDQGINKITTLMVNGSINITMIFHNNEKTILSFDSIKSILTAASKTTNTESKALFFNQTITDQDGELSALVVTCTEKNWSVSGLTIN